MNGTWSWVPSLLSPFVSVDSTGLLGWDNTGVPSWLTLALLCPVLF